MIINILIKGSKTNLEVKENKDKSVYVKGAKEVHINNPSEVFKVIDEGQANRHVAATGINTISMILMVNRFIENTWKYVGSWNFALPLILPLL